MLIIVQCGFILNCYDFPRSYTFNILKIICYQTIEDKMHDSSSINEPSEETPKTKSRTTSQQTPPAPCSKPIETMANSLSPRMEET